MSTKEAKSNKGIWAFFKKREKISRGSEKPKKQKNKL